jgi:DNA topoisomerase-1
MVARNLGNTPAVCRSSYVHPEIITAYEAGLLPAISGRRSTVQRSESLKAWLAREIPVFLLLRDRLEKRQKMRAAA